MQDAGNYYEISNWFDDGSDYVGTPKINKVVGGTTVDSHVYLSNRYLQGGAYPIKVTFSPTLVTWEAFGLNAPGGYTYVDSAGGSISVQTIELNFWQQDANIDNIRLHTTP